MKSRYVYSGLLNSNNENYLGQQELSLQLATDCGIDDDGKSRFEIKQQLFSSEDVFFIALLEEKPSTPDKIVLHSNARTYYFPNFSHDKFWKAIMLHNNSVEHVYVGFPSIKHFVSS